MMGNHPGMSQKSPITDESPRTFDGKQGFTRAQG
jgi:hypothetical protein